MGPLAIRDRMSFVNTLDSLIALTKTDISGDLNYSERLIVEKLVDVCHVNRMISRNVEQQSLTTYTAYYNQYRNHQAPENQTSIAALRQEDSI